MGPLDSRGQPVAGAAVSAQEVVNLPDLPPVGVLEEGQEFPVEWDRPWMASFLNALAVMPNVTAAAQAAGITRQHANAVRRENPLFAAACQEALLRSHDLLKRYAWQMGTTGVPVATTVVREKRRAGEVVETETVTTNTRVISPSMTQFLLRAHDPATYCRDVRVTHSGPDGGPIQVDLQVRLDAARARFKDRLDGVASAGAAGELAPGSS